MKPKSLPSRPKSAQELTVGQGLRFCLCVALASQQLTAGPLPSGATVVNGELRIQTAGTRMDINQSSKFGIVNWDSFNVGAGHAVNFNNGSGATLNRVTGLDASSINGRLTATGSLFLINRNGIIIGADGQVLTGGAFVASTLDISNADFLRGGGFSLFGNSPKGVTNLGKISSTTGDVLLAGYTVSNLGTITAPAGRVGLAAGTQIDVVTDAGWLNGAYAVSLGERDHNVTNEGRIQALAAELRTFNGNIYALAGNNTGLIQATGVTEKDGRVYLTAANGTVQSTGTVTATRGTDGGDIRIEAANVENYGGTQNVSGQNGGTITIKTDAITSDTAMLAKGISGAGGTITIDANREVLLTSAGLLDAAGTSAGGNISVRSGPGTNLVSATLDATASSGKGGTVSLLGDRVSLFGASVDASGATGGGTVLVGGGYQGALVQEQANASRTYISDKTTLRADTTGESGQGGTVVAWADGTTEFAGTITARGGSASGNGGLVETSGLEGLGVSGSVDASAPSGNGEKGQWLLDPKNITIGTVTDALNEFQKITRSFGDIPSETTSTVNFGQYIDISGDTLVVGAPAINTAFVFENGFLAARLTAPNGADFGEGVGVNGNIIAVFSGAETYYDNYTRLGVTHIYARSTGWRNGSASRAMVFNNPTGTPSDLGFGQSTGSGNNLRFSLGSMPNGSRDALLAIGNPNYGNGGNYGAVYTAIIPGNTTPATTPTTGTFKASYQPGGVTNRYFGSTVIATDGLVYVKGASNNTISVTEPYFNSVTDFTLSYPVSLFTVENGHFFSLSGTSLYYAKFNSSTSKSYETTYAINVGSSSTSPTSIAFSRPDAYTQGTLLIGRGNEGVVYGYGPTSWTSSSTMQPTFTVSAAGTGLGYSLAIDNDYAAFGKPSVSSNRGEILTYRRTGDTWAADSTLVPATHATSTSLGRELVSDANWGTVVFSDLQANNASIPDGTNGGFGRVYVYENGSLAATLTSKSHPASAIVGFGHKLAVNNNRIAVTSFIPMSGSGGVTSTALGRVQLYDKGTAWRNGSANQGWHYDFHGMIGAVDLSGNTLAVGTPVPTSGQPGSVFIFPSISATSFGTTPITLQNPNRVNGVADNFGNSLALAGNTLAVGQPRSPSAGYYGVNRGQVFEDLSTTGLTDYNIYLFENRASNWSTATATRLAGSTILSSTQDSVGWGYSLALNETGDTLVTGYHRDAALNTTRGVYVFQRNGTWANSATPVARLTGSARNFGFDVDIYNDTIAVSSPNYHDAIAYPSPTGAHSSIFVFQKHTAWTSGSSNLVATLIPATNVTNEYFGTQIALTSNGLYASSAGIQSGSSTMAPIYQFNGPFEATARASFNTNPGSNLNISATALTGALAKGTNIKLQANNDITVSSALNVNNLNGDGGDLTLEAGRSILVNASITTDNGDLTLIANAAGANADYRDAGERFVVLGRDAANASVTLSLGTGNLVIAAADRFENRTGSTNPFRFATVNPGRFLVYSTTPNQTGAPDATNLQADLSTIGRDWVHYGRTFNAATPIPSDLPAGDGFLYSVTPTVSVSVGNASLTYGDTFSSAPLTLGSVTVANSAVTASTFGLASSDLTHLVNLSLANNLSTNPANALVNAGIYASAITATAKTTVSSGSVYGVAVSASGAGTLTVAKKALSVAPDNASRTYGDANPTFTATYSGFVTGDSVSVLDTLPFLSTTATSTSDVSSANYPITASGGLDNNYSFSFPSVGALSITPRDLLLSGLTGVSRIYDATTRASFTGTPIVSPINGDSVTLSGTATASASFANKDVGTQKALTFSGYSLAGTKATNYRLIFPTNVTANVTPATLFLAGLTALDRDYDQTLSVSFSGSAAVSPFVGDTVSVSGTPSGSFVDKHAGSAKPVSVSGLSLSGPAAANYVLSTSGLTAAIRPRALDIAGLSATSRTYDATTAATVSGTPSATPLSGDSVILSGTASGSFTTKHVGTAKPVNVDVSGLSLSGNDRNNYVLRSPANLTANITPADLLVFGITAVDRIYDATTLAQISGTPSVAPLGFDKVTLSGTASGSFATKDASTTAKPVSVSISSLALTGDDSANYLLIAPSGLTATISPRPVAVSGLSAQDRTYDSTTHTIVNGTPTFSGILANDNATISTSTLSYAFPDKHVGTAKPITVSGLSISGTDANNYDLNKVEGLTASITPAPLSVAGVSAQNRTYDATTFVSLSGGALSGILADDSVSLLTANASGSLIDKHASISAKPVTASGFALAGSDARNYALIQPSGLSVTISQATATLLNLSADKTYDGTNRAPLSASGLSGLFLDDQVSPDFSGVTAIYSDKHVGQNRPVSLSGSFTLSGQDAQNYVLTQPASLSGSVAKLGITVDGLAIANKTYDGSTTASIAGTGSFGGILSGDDLAIDVGAVNVSFADANAGQNKAIALSGITLSGRDKDNYSAATPSNLSASILQKDLSVSGLAALDRTYDRSTSATLSGSASLVGLISGEFLTLVGSPSAAFTDKHVGPAKPVSVSGLSLTSTSTSLASNYRLLPPSLTATITPADASVLGLSALDRTYDATTNAPLSGTASLDFGSLNSVLTNAESISLSGIASGSFATKDVGSAKPITVSGLALSGSDARNYTLRLPANLSASITPATLSISGTRIADKTYDATPSATFASYGSITPLANDSVSLATSAASASFLTKDAGSAKLVSLSGLSLSGQDAANYTITQPSGLSASISQAELIVSGYTAANKVYDATTAAPIDGTARYTPIGQDSVFLSGRLAAAFTDKHVGSAKPVILSDLTLSGTDSANYRLTFAPLAADITPALLALSGLTARDRIYDGTTLATLAGTATFSPIGSDTVRLSGTPSATFTTKDVATTKSVTVSTTGLTLSGADAQNYALLAPTALTASVTPKAITVIGTDAFDRPYDRTTAVTLSGGTLSGTIARDDINLVATAASGTIATANASATPKPVTASGYILSGQDARNYTLTQPTDINVLISRLLLDVQGIEIADKLFDGNTNATPSGGRPVGILSGDAVSLITTAAQARFADSEIGSKKPVTLTGLTLDGSDAANYQINPDLKLTGRILPALKDIKDVIPAEVLLASANSAIESRRRSLEAAATEKGDQVKTFDYTTFSNQVSTGLVISRPIQGLLATPPAQQDRFVKAYIAAAAVATEASANAARIVNNYRETATAYKAATQEINQAIRIIAVEQGLRDERIAQIESVKPQLARAEANLAAIAEAKLAVADMTKKIAEANRLGRGAAVAEYQRILDAAKAVAATESEAVKKRDDLARELANATTSLAESDAKVASLQTAQTKLTAQLETYKPQLEADLAASTEAKAKAAAADEALLAAQFNGAKATLDDVKTLSSADDLIRAANSELPAKTAAKMVETDPFVTQFEAKAANAAAVTQTLGQGLATALSPAALTYAENLAKTASSGGLIDDFSSMSDALIKSTPSLAKIQSEVDAIDKEQAQKASQLDAYVNRFANFPGASATRERARINERLNQLVGGSLNLDQVPKTNAKGEALTEIERISIALLNKQLHTPQGLTNQATGLANDYVNRLDNEVAKVFGFSPKQALNDPKVLADVVVDRLPINADGSLDKEQLAENLKTAASAYINLKGALKEQAMRVAAENDPTGTGQALLKSERAARDEFIKNYGAEPEEVLQSKINERIDAYKNADSPEALLRVHAAGVIPGGEMTIEAATQAFNDLKAGKPPTEVAKDLASNLWNGGNGGPSAREEGLKAARTGMAAHEAAISTLEESDKTGIVKASNSILGAGDEEFAKTFGGTPRELGLKAIEDPAAAAGQALNAGKDLFTTPDGALNAVKGGVSLYSNMVDATLATAQKQIDNVAAKFGGPGKAVAFIAKHGITAATEVKDFLQDTASTLTGGLIEKSGPSKTEIENAIAYAKAEAELAQAKEDAILMEYLQTAQKLAQAKAQLASGVVNAKAQVGQYLLATQQQKQQEQTAAIAKQVTTEKFTQIVKDGMVENAEKLRAATTTSSSASTEEARARDALWRSQ